jgi:mono/diheme cytochrome c family protein
MRLAPAFSRKVPFIAYPALGLLIFTGACASGASESLTVEPEAANPGLLIAAGAEVYGNNCARCHNARAAAEKTDLEWDLIVAHMRARANLTGGQARAVQAFLATVNAPSGGAEG